MQIDIYTAMVELASYALYQKSTRVKTQPCSSIASIICQSQNLCSSSQPPETDCNQHSMFFLSLGRILLMNRSNHAVHIFHLEWWRRNKKKRKGDDEFLFHLWVHYAHLKAALQLHTLRSIGGIGPMASLNLSGLLRGDAVGFKCTGPSVGTNFTLLWCPCNTIPEYYILIWAVGLTH